MNYAPGAMAPPQVQGRSVAPETFLLDQDAQQSLPPDSIVALQQVDNLKYFLISAPVDWNQDQYIRRFLLPTGEYVSCVLWSNLFHISGTDIVRCLSFRFQAFGRPVKNSKKFEEGIFSDLRNLKSGTDASLEEPKSPFLDFLYKNNCIRTQKKQKVFYWYSVPHDRLFLDALERDLKREKMGQEPTTVAVSEPALSFEFDSSQSLFEQLTKAQQTNSSSFNANVQTYSQSTSPVMRALDSMPPPQMVPQPQIPATVPEDQMAAFTGMPMHAMPPSVSHSREPSYGPLTYDRNGVPLHQIKQRHTSMPAYMEYSPAPSFVSSQYEDYSTQPAYIANEDTGLYTALPDSGISGNFNNMQLPPSNLMGSGGFGQVRPNFPSANSFSSVIEGSPTYKQRRRRSSLSAGVSAAITATGNNQPHNPHQAHRPSELRRSMSASVMPVLEADEAVVHAGMGGMPMKHPQPQHQPHDLLDLSRHGTPLATVEDEQPLDDFSALTHGDFGDASHGHPGMQRAGAPVFRRARSATMTELGPYPQKSHSCPIPTCGRLFKRLEHLKRHVRTHTQERPYVCTQCNKAFSRSDNLAQHKRTHEANKDGDSLGALVESEEDLEGEEGIDLGALDEDGSPTSDHGFDPSALSMHHGVHDLSATLAGLPTPNSTMIPAQGF